jgi:hypothetical protein
MAIFLNRAQIYRILQRELPEDIYPDGAPSQYISTAENDSIAGALETVYNNMEAAYVDMFPMTSLNIEAWEAKVFNEVYVGALSLDDRRNRVLAFLRNQPDISYWTIITTVASFLPYGASVKIANRGRNSPTIVGQIMGENSDLVWNRDWTAGDPAPAGVTVTDDIRNNYSSMLNVRETAYTYDVTLYGTAITTDLRDAIDAALTLIEPARSAHTITVLASDLLPSPIEATMFNAEDYENIFKDPASSSGYYIIKKTYFGFDGDDFAFGFTDVYDYSQGGIWFFTA